MPTRLKFEGLAELKAELRKLTPALASEGGREVEAAAQDAATEVRSGYGSHRRSGSMQDKVTVTHRASRDGAVATLTSGDQDALVFEVGSQARHTRIGANRGAMPPGHVFFPAVIRAKRRMWGRLKYMLQQHGFTVSGDA